MTLTIRALTPILLSLAAWAAAGCATSHGERERESLAPMLQTPSERPYEVVGRLHVRGDPGEPVRHVHDELRWRANALGADAVVKTGESELPEHAPAPYDPPDRPLLGNAYPGPLRSLEPGAFPPAGRDLKVRGRYYVVEGIAIRYLD